MHSLCTYIVIFFNDTATTEIYTLSLHDALPISVKMNGQKQVLEVRIEPEAFAGKDQEMLQDLVRAAVNEASRRVDDELADQMKSLAGGIPGMAGMKSPGWFYNSKESFQNQHITKNLAIGNGRRRTR